MINTILKIIFLIIGIKYSYLNTARALKGQRVSSKCITIMSIGIVGFLAFQLGWLAF